MFDITNLATNASRNARINEVEGETSDITNFILILPLLLKIKYLMLMLAI